MHGWAVLQLRPEDVNLLPSAVLEGGKEPGKGLPSPNVPRPVPEGAPGNEEEGGTLFLRHAHEGVRDKGKGAVSPKGEERVPFHQGANFFEIVFPVQRGKLLEGKPFLHEKGTDPPRENAFVPPGERSVKEEDHSLLFIAASTKPRKRGLGRRGREVSSGWNCEATK